MNPQPPVTNMRIEARTSSSDAGAPADFPTVRDQLRAWQTRLAQVDWVPWIIVGFAALLRLLLLGVKPPHFDEGINGWFVDQMVKSGFYKYDPTNYHGPLHFYVLFLSETLLGRNVWALRLPVVIVSTLCVWLMFKFEPLVGRTAARLAALAMAVSPGFVFYGRYSIHEVWLVLFSMLFVLGLLGLWKSGTSKYLWCTGIGFAGMVLTKETYIIHLGCAVLAAPAVWISTVLPKFFSGRRQPIAFALSLFLIAAFFMPWLQAAHGRISGFRSLMLLPFGICFWIAPVFACATVIWSLLRRNNRVFAGATGVLSLLAIVFVSIGTADAFAYGAYLTIGVGAGLLIVALMPSEANLIDSRPAKQTWSYVDLAVVAGVSIALVVFFYSGTFLNWKGVTGIFQTYTAWFETGHDGHGHGKPWYYWLQLMAPSGRISRADFLGYELPALTGLVVCFFCLRFKGISLRYLAIYGVGTLIAYSIVYYKTPWCIISFAWPFLFIFGAAIFAIPDRFRRLTNIVSAVLLLQSFASTIWLNYFHCTTDKEPYVYVQTYNDIYKITDPVLALPNRDPVFYMIVGHVIRPSSYPLPWMLGDFPHVGYYEHDDLPKQVDADFLLVQEDRVDDVEAKLHDSYYTDWMTIRSYQDASKIYLSAKTFKDFFPGKAPDFIGPKRP